MDNNETLADIIAEMREGRVFAWEGCKFEGLADRIEAAAKREREERHDYELAECERCDRANTATMRQALERILDIEGYGAPMIEAKCVAQKALEGQQCTPPIAQEGRKLSNTGNAAAMREALKFASRVLAKWQQDAPFSAWSEYDEAIIKARAALDAPPEPPSNAAVMREAIMAIKSINDGRPHDAAGYEINDIIEEALSAPTRNCDRYKDAPSAYADFIVPWKLDGHLDDVPTLQDFANWLFATAEKGADA